MKTFAILIGFFFALAMAGEEKKSPLVGVMETYGGACTEELKTSDETLGIIKKLEGADNEEVQCWWACLFEKADLMKDAKIQYEALEEAMKKSEEADSAKIEKLIEIFKSCKDEAEVSDDACEVMGKYGKCLVPKMMANE